MKYIIYIPESNTPGATFSHYGIKGRSGKFKYGSGLYPFQDLRRSGVMNWSLGGLKKSNDVSPGALLVKRIIRANPSIQSVFTKADLLSNSQEQMCRVYLTNYTKTKEYREMSRINRERRMSYRENMTPEQRKVYLAERDEALRLDKLYKQQQGQKIDEETGLHLKDPERKIGTFRATYAEMNSKDMDAHMREICDDIARVNYMRRPSYRDGRTTDNCGICTLAYDMRRRGYDVSAKTGYNFKVPFVYRDTYLPEHEIFRAKVDLNAENYREVGAKVYLERREAYDKIVKEFETRFPNESRGYILGHYAFVGKNGNFVSDGHAFNFERHNGNTYLVDSQRNFIYDIRSEKARTELEVYDLIRASRTDNIEPYAKDLLKNVLE